MHSVGVHKVMKQLTSLFYRMGLWYRGDVPTARITGIRALYFSYYLLIFASLFIGAITSENVDESVFLTGASIMVAVLTVKLWILIWKQKEILELLNRICVFSIQHDDDFAFFNKKLGKFMKFVVVFLLGPFLISIPTIVVAPIFERKFLAEIAFPWDYKNNDAAFWIAHIFIVTEVYLSVILITVSSVIWYLMYNCSLRYEVLGREIERMGRIIVGTKKKMSEKEKREVFFQNLKVSIDNHLHLKGLIDELASFTCNLFFIKFGTSGICICGSVYSLAFYDSNNYVDKFYHIYTLFYYVSEFIFGEYLKKPQVLLIGKLYPLTLASFTRILNSAYSLFNILKNTKQ